MKLVNVQSQIATLCAAIRVMYYEELLSSQIDSTLNKKLNRFGEESLYFIFQERPSTFWSNLSFGPAETFLTTQLHS